jgi:hypothetical protein
LPDEHAVKSGYRGEAAHILALFKNSTEAGNLLREVKQQQCWLSSKLDATTDVADPFIRFESAIQWHNFEI